MSLALEQGTMYLTHREKPLLENLNFTFQKGKSYFIYCRQKQEKGLLVAALSGLVLFDKGALKFENQSINRKTMTEYRKKQVGFILKDYNFLPNKSPLQNLYAYCQLNNRKVTKNDCLALLKKVGIEKETSQIPMAKLDDITKKKYELIKATSRKPEVFVADGLLDNLDSYTEKLFLNYLTYLLEEKNMCVIVTVEKQHLSYFPDVVLGLNRGKLNFIKTN